MVIVPVRVVPPSAVSDLFRRQTEEEEILLARLLRHFDRCAIPRPDCQGAVHHEFHVACATGFIACGRDLVGNITGRDQPLRERNVVFGQKQNPEPISRRRVGIDCASQVLDEFDNELGELVGWRSLAGEKKRTRRHF